MARLWVFQWRLSVWLYPSVIDFSDCYLATTRSLNSELETETETGQVTTGEHERYLL
jgi:hypothetical protein